MTWSTINFYDSQLWNMGSKSFFGDILVFHALSWFASLFLMPWELLCGIEFAKGNTGNIKDAVADKAVRDHIVKCTNSVRCQFRLLNVASCHWQVAAGQPYFLLRHRSRVQMASRRICPACVCNVGQAQRINVFHGEQSRGAIA